MNDFGDFIQQYYHQQTCNQPSQETLKNNLEIFRKEHAERLNEAGRHFVYDPLSEYEKRIAEKALTECKNSNEWRALEADDIRFKATGVMNAMGAEELLERYKQKIQAAYRVEDWLSKQIQTCDKKLVELSELPQTKSVANKIKHWKERKLTYDIGLCEQIQKTNRYEQLQRFNVEKNGSLRIQLVKSLLRKKYFILKPLKSGCDLIGSFEPIPQGELKNA